jgi:hypothetical protein
MSVVIIATYPWEDIKAISGNEEPRAWMLSDSRITRVSRITGLSPGPADVKQVILARNLIAGFASSNVSATRAALKLKEQDPSTRDLNSVASERDLRRLGKLLKAQHDRPRVGGNTLILAALWPRGAKGPLVYELMPPRYVPLRRTGIVGVGVREVLEHFKTGLPDQLRSQRLTSDDVQFDPRWISALERQFPGWPRPIVWEQAMLATHVAFVDSLIDVDNRYAAIPATMTLIHKDGIDQSRRSKVLKQDNKLIDVSLFGKPRHYPQASSERYTGEELTAMQLFP